MAATQAKERASQRLAVASIASSVVLSGGLLATLVAYDSEIVAAQLADSFVDVLTGLALLVAIRISLRPPDANHPFGHERAEPIAALVVAVVAGAVAIEVVTGAVDALVAGARPVFATPVLAVLLAKGALKAAIAVVARRARAGQLRPSLHALEVDARNDALVSAVAIAGALLSTLGLFFLDAILAGLTGLWIAWTGFSLARENVRLLMGESVPDSDLEAYRRLAAATDGVRGVGAVRARFHGTSVEVAVTVVVDEELSVRRAHDIGAAVRERIEARDEVAWATVHIDAPSTTSVETRERIGGGNGDGEGEETAGHGHGHGHGF